METISSGADIEGDGWTVGVTTVGVFFFKQKTAYEIYQCDWSSDVCSSDLAESRKQGAMMQAIDKIYPKRFGADWRNRIDALFKKYGSQANQLISKNSFSPVLTDDERDFVRMVELGAGMANLDYGTKPSPKNTVDSAMKLYKELGLLS